MYLSHLFILFFYSVSNITEHTKVFGLGNKVVPNWNGTFGHGRGHCVVVGFFAVLLGK